MAYDWRSWTDNARANLQHAGRPLVATGLNAPEPVISACSRLTPHYLASRYPDVAGGNPRQLHKDGGGRTAGVGRGGRGMVLKPAPILKAEAHAEHAATIAAAHRFAERCRAQFSASQVYLFGSRARGDWYRGSDCDVLVISDRFDGEPMWSRPVTMYQVWDGPPGVSIEPVGLTPAEFDAARDKGGLVSYAIADGLIPLLKLADRQT